MTTRSSVGRVSTANGGFTLLEVMAAVLILGVWFAVLAGAAMQGLRSEGEAERRLRAELIADARMSDLEGAAQLGALPPIGEDAAQQDDFEIHTRVTALDLPTVAAAAAAGGPAPAAVGGAATTPEDTPGTGTSGSRSGSSPGRSGANAIASRLAAQRAAQGARRPGRGPGSLGAGAARGVPRTPPGAPSGTAAGAAGAAASAALPANASFFAPTPGRGTPPLRQIQVEVVWQDLGGPRSVIRTSYALDSQAAAPLLQALDQAAQQAEAATEGPSPDEASGDPESREQEPEVAE